MTRPSRSKMSSRGRNYRLRCPAPVDEQASAYLMWHRCLVDSRLAYPRADEALIWCTPGEHIWWRLRFNEGQ